MKRFLLKIGLVGIVFVLINFLFLFMVSIFIIEFEKTNKISKFKNKQFDCIITGNSLALDAFDAEYMTKNGISSYNFAMGGASFVSNIIQLENFLKDNPPPKLIVLGLGSHFIDRNLDKKSVHPVIEYFYLDSKLGLETLPIVRFQWYANEMLKLLFSSDHRQAHSSYGQYRSKRAVPDKSKLKEGNANFDYQTFLASEDFKRFRKIIDKYKIDFIIFEMPLFLSQRNNHPELRTVVVDSLLSFKIINMNRFDVCEELFNPKKDWLGNSHLNLYGGRKFTEYITNRYLKPALKENKN
jgi:hypothetical protein